MTLDALIMLAGAFVAVLPSLGFPNSWDSVLFFLAGIFIIALGIVVRRRRGSSGLTTGGSSGLTTGGSSGLTTGGSIYGEQSRTTKLATGGSSVQPPQKNSGTPNENPPHVGQ